MAWSIVLAGCSASEVVQNLTLPVTGETSQPDYRRVIASNIRTLFPDPSKVGRIEISGTRPVDHLKGQAWLTCLRLDSEGHPQHYAVFIQGDKIIDFRGGVVIDECHKQAYSPFATETPANKPGS